MNLFFISFVINLLALFFPLPEKTSPDFDIKILEHKYLKETSSLSAIGIHDEDIYVAGDDIPWIIELDPEWDVKNKIKIAGKDSLANGRTPSSIKADYESMEIFRDKGKDYMLVLSSGSRSITRDTAVLVSWPDTQKILKKNIRPLYEKIKTAAGFNKKEEINIEGLAMAGEKTYLFHRGNISGNFIVVMNTVAFIRYLESDDNVAPEFEIYRFQLPEHNGIQSGFSGACNLPGQSALLFTASMENTRSVTADGEITGSYIGIIPISGLAEGKYSVKLVMDKGKPLAKKLEGIAIKSWRGNNYVLMLVSDNDDGSSDLFRIGLNFHR